MSPQHNVHNIMPDEPSESAEKWLRELRPRALVVDTDIPFIDSDSEEDLEVIEEISERKIRKSLTFSDEVSLKRSVSLIQSCR